METKNSEEIVGRWEAVQTTRGGLGSILEFSRDGTLNVSFGPLLHGTYKLNGSRLIENTFQPDGSQTTEDREIEIKGDTLIMEADDIMEGYKISLVRLTLRELDSSPIVGRWKQMDVTAHRPFLESTILEYSKSGEFTFRMSLSSSKGRYGISGDLLTTMLEFGTKISTFRIENGFLFLRSSSEEGPEDKFKRSGCFLSTPSSSHSRGFED